MIGMFAYLIYGIVSWLGAGLFGSPLGSLSIGGIPLGLIVGLFTACYGNLLASAGLHQHCRGGRGRSSRARVVAFGIRPDRIAGLAVH